jgi:hypothetical protein
MPPNKEGHDPSFLWKSSFSRESGICPTACYSNAAPAVLYEKVGLGLLAWSQLKCGSQSCHVTHMQVQHRSCFRHNYLTAATGMPWPYHMTSQRRHAACMCDLQLHPAPSPALSCHGVRLLLRRYGSGVSSPACTLVIYAAAAASCVRHYCTSRALLWSAVAHSPPPAAPRLAAAPQPSML